MDKKKIIGSLIILFFFIVFFIAGFFIFKGQGNSNDLVILNGEDKKVTIEGNKTAATLGNETKKYIKAQIYGEVKNPGVYSLKEGDRIKDLVNAAGGYNENANKFSVNNAKKLNDGDNIEIKKVGEKTIAEGSNNSSQNDEKLNLNNASEAEIVSKKIPGIGAALAKKIVQYRENNNGRINSIEELGKAIGTKRAANIIGYITFN